MAKKPQPEIRKMIIHTKEEKQAISEAAIKILLEDPTSSRIAAVVKAQKETMPPKRRRILDDWAKVKSWINLPAELEAQFGPGGIRTAPEAAAPVEETTESKAVPGVTSRKDGMKRVYWKPDEQASVAHGAAMAIHLGQTKSKVEAINMGQGELEETRRRNINSTGLLPWFPEAFEKALKKIKNAQEKLEKQKTAEAEAVEIAKQHVLPPAPPPNALISATLQGALGTIRGALVIELATIFREALTMAIEGIPELPIPATPQAPAFVKTPSSSKQKKPVILIAGLKGGQKGVIEMEFGTFLDLRFYGSDESKDLLRSMCEKADVAVAFTDFLSHSHTDIMKNRAKKFVPTGGGMTNLKDVLRNLHSEFIATPA